MLKKIGGCFGSLRVAVVLLALLALVCGWATFIERDFGTPVVQMLVYRAIWFHALIALLGLNVLAAALVRLPWKKGHLPFLLAHGGILILIVGCYLTFSRGVEGKMTIAEGTSSSTAVRSNDWAIRIERIGGADEKTDKAQTVGEKSVEIQFSGGPISRALLTRDGWKKYVVKPREARRDEPRTFFARLLRSVSRIHLSAVRRLAKWTAPNPRTIPTGVKGLTLELLDYVVAGEVEEKEGGDFTIHPAPFNKETANEFYAQLHLRAQLDGQESVFWIRTLPTGVSEAEARFLSRTVASEKRAVRIALVNQTFDPGFSLHVQKFEPLFEPGSSTPASFSSVVDYRLTGGEAEGAADAAAKESMDTAPLTKTIGMNRPGKFFSPTKGRVWTYQDSYRGPYFPGQPIFEQTVKGELLPGETVPREKIYETVLSLNADPGRPWKYFGSFLIVLGTYLLIRHRKKVERGAAVAAPLAVLILCVCAAAPLSAEDSTKAEPTNAETAKTESPVNSPAAAKKAFQPDWSAWRLLPVASGGRIMPLDTFARQTVRELCGSIRPEIAPDVRLIEALEKGTFSNLPPFDEMLAGHEISDAEREAMKKEYDRLAADSAAEQKKIAERLRKIFPGNKARRFEPEELIFAWIVEPEVWRYIPFLRDPDDSIGRLTGSKKGGKFARLEKGRLLSPSEVERCADFSSRIDRLQKREASLYPDSEAAKREGNIDRAAATVERNLSAFRAVAFFPGREPPPMSSYYLDQILYPPENAPMGESAPPILEQLDRSCATFKTLLRDEKNQKIDSPFEDDSFLLTQTIRAGRSGNERVILDLIRRILLLAPLAEKGNYAESARQFGELLDECFAAKNRLTAHRDAAISGKLGTEPYRRELLRCAYLMEEVVRRIESATLALSTTGSYRISTLADKKRLRARESGASTEFEGAPAAALSILETGSLDLLPNGALPLLKTGDESARSPWISIQSILLMPDGLAKRFLGAADSDSSSKDVSPKDASAKTAGSFLDMLSQKVQADRERNSDGARAKAAEAFLSAAEIYIGKKSGSSDDWNRALSEFSAALADLGAESNQTRLESAGLAPNDSSPAIAKTFYPNADAVQKLRAETLYNRLDAFYWLWFFSLLGVGALTLGELGERFSSRKTAENGPKLLGKIGFISTTLFLSLAALLTAAGGALRAFITGWAPVTNMFETVVLLAFFVLILTLGYTYWPFFKRLAPNVEKTRSIYARRGMIFLGGLLALGIGLAAYYNRAEFNPNIRPPVAVLRSNFWLTIHVLAIIASYACGSVAWFLSLTMLGGYLFGRRPNVPSPSPGESRGSSTAAFEPVICAKIAPIVLQMLRWATLLLTVGTILGALWADFSWGRFWSWDPKEVWALVTLLIYLVVLHARLFMRRSNFGLAVGGVVGAMAIIMTWYGLSFVFGGGGRHAYTGGESNKELILYSLLAANILLAVAAAYWRFYFRK